MNANGERPLTAYLIHSIPLLQSAVQIFAGDKMTVVAHLVGLEQIGYEKILGMSMGVSTNWNWYDHCFQMYVPPLIYVGW